jgi:acetyl-CoA C-acetyltransferase
MAEGIKDKVAIIGMGCTRFGELWDKSGPDLIIDAYQECMQDAGMEMKDIDAAWFSTLYPMQGLSGIQLAQTLHLPYIPVTHVENLCASGTEAIRGATYALASGAIDVALCVGMEKLKDVGYGGLPDMRPPSEQYWAPNASGPGVYAMMATRYFAVYGLSPEEGKKMLARVSWKSHQNGAKHPKAHLKKAIELDAIINAPIIAWPLGLFDCCGVSDGAAAAILVRTADAKKFRKDPVLIKGCTIAAASGEDMWYTDYDYAHAETGFRAGQRVYKEAGIKNPREEISMAEVHDCFSITEAVTMEDLQFSPRGKVKEDIESGFFDLTGGLPVQPDGGLKCFGHPIGASGLRMIYECYKQLQGKAGDRQIKDPKLGLTHNMGGYPPWSVVGVAIVGN